MPRTTERQRIQRKKWYVATQIVRSLETIKFYRDCVPPLAPVDRRLLYEQDRLQRLYARQKELVAALRGLCDASQSCECEPSLASAPSGGSAKC